MAKFSKKGWSSYLNYDNFSSGGLERHIDNLRDDLAGRHEGSAKPRRVHETAGYVSGFGSVSSNPYTPSPCPKETMDFAAELRNRRIREIEEGKNAGR